MKRPCIDCQEQGRYVLTERTRCPEHARREQRRIDAMRGSPAQRGYDADYRRVRGQVLEAYDFTCAYCGRGPRPGDPIHVDHIVPLARGGTSDPSNLVAAHRSCNSRKGARKV